jgi:signal transduction histidine kinase/ActR/RegA family two-component response regulator
MAWTIGRKTWRLIGLFLFSLLCFDSSPAKPISLAKTLSPSFLLTSTSKKVKIGLSDAQAMFEGTNINENVAFTKDYVQALAEYANWSYEYVPGDWDTLLSDLSDGTIDLLLDVTKTDARTAYYNFSSESMGTEMVYLYGPSDTSLSYNDFSGFNNKVVGYEDGSTIVDSLQKFADQNGFAFTRKAYANNAAIFAGLDAKEVDLAVTTNYFTIPSAHSFLSKCMPAPVYIATSKKARANLQQEVDDAMGLLFSYNPGFNSDLYEYHFGKTLSSTAFSADEKAYIAKNPTINVFYENSWAPFEYQKNNQAMGITPDVVRAIGQETGLNFQFILNSSTSAIYTDIDTSPHDTIMAVSYSYTWANSHDLLATQPYVNGSVLEVLKDASTEPTTVAVVSSGYLANQIAIHYPELQQIPFDNFDQAMEAVRKGEAGCTFLNFFQSTYYRSMFNYESFTYRPVAEMNQALSLGVTTKSDPVLLQVLSKALQRLSTTTLQSILSSNSVYNEPYSLSTMLRRNPVQGALLIALIVLLLCILLFSIVTSESRKRRAHALAVAKAEADKANAAKSEFLSRMSHDIRTPLNGIVGMTYLAEKENTSPAVADYLGKIDASSKFLLSLVNDILDMSKAESGEILLHPEGYPCTELADYLNAVFTPLVGKKHQNLIFDLPHDEKRVPLLDKLRINQILFNLLSNAVKFTPENGKINCTMKQIDKSDGNCELTFEVQDNGIGMSPEFLKVIFDTFTQEERNDNIRQSQGTGLGMAIAKRLVDAMKGTISVISVQGKGSTFTIVLPASTISEEDYRSAKEETRHESDSATGCLKGKRILLCEDNVLNQEIARKLLSAKGIEVTVAKDGSEGLALYQASNAKPYDLILMDLRMPNMTGYEATEAIRKCANPDAKSIPIIAMTADAFGEDVQKCLASGMNAHIAKPIDPERLYETLVQYLGPAKTISCPKADTSKRGP